jgi:glucose/mannose-6-phosphate isomerase
MNVDTMKELINNFRNQFKFRAEMKNKENLKPAEEFIVMGMGGSHLPADIFKTRDPYLPIYVHRNYHLPPLPPERLKKSLLIAISHSGNTEETLDFARETLEHDYRLGVIATGGKLLTLAEKNKIPYIKVPAENLEPRHSLGYMTVALAEFINGGSKEELESLYGSMDSSELEEEGRLLSEFIGGRLAVIYASERNYGLAYIWKAKINETSKVPALWNVFPELNHNELAGFDVNSKTKKISENFRFIFLDDPADQPKIKKRMETTKEVYESKGLPVAVSKLRGKTPFEKIFNSLILADWISFFLSQKYDTDPFSNKLVEDFKRKIN